MEEFVLVVAGALVALVIILYATWLFAYRLRTGDSPTKSFWQWLKHIAEAILGI